MWPRHCESPYEKLCFVPQSKHVIHKHERYNHSPVKRLKFHVSLANGISCTINLKKYICTPSTDWIISRENDVLTNAIVSIYTFKLYLLLEYVDKKL